MAVPVEVVGSGGRDGCVEGRVPGCGAGAGRADGTAEVDGGPWVEGRAPEGERGGRGVERLRKDMFAVDMSVVEGLWK